MFSQFFNILFGNIINGLFFYNLEENKRKKIKKIENEQVVTISNPSIFQWPPANQYSTTKQKASTT